MNLAKKALSLGTSAALVAALLATAVAPATLAAITQTSAGNVAQGSTSAGTATFTFTENSAAALTTTGTMYVTITDSASVASTVSFVGTPVLSGNVASLGASASIANNVLSIKITGHDDSNIETLTVSGLKIAASSTAASGNIIATLTDSTGLAINNSGSLMYAFVGTNVTATGKLSQAYGIGQTTWLVANDPGACLFTGANAITVGSETVTGPTYGAAPVGQQQITASAFTTNHLANEVVSQTVPNCAATGTSYTLGAPATVVTAAALSYDGPYTVFPGETNSPAGDIYVKEPSAGFLAAATTLTYTIATPGVVFSGTPTVVDDNTVMVLSGPVLSADRTSVVVTVSTAGTVNPAEVTLENIKYDVASTVPGGTFIDVNVALSGGLLITGNPAENAVVWRGIAASAPTPTVYIGENAQATGLITLTEATPGFFQSGTGDNNVIAICTQGVEYSFTFAPSAKVTSGDLLLRNGLVSAPVGTAVAGVLIDGCYTWTVWAGSTVASTIVIGNSTFTSGPLINVNAGQAPGAVIASIYSGNDTVYTDYKSVAKVAFAIAAFRNQVAVTALGQPVIPAGAKTKAGAIQVAETAYGQIKRFENICVEVLPRSSTTILKQDVTLQALTTADLPTVTASGGLLVGPIEVSNTDCSNLDLGITNQATGLDGLIENLLGSGTNMVSFSFPVLQQSTTAAGKLVIDNINYITTADAPVGPVLVNVYGFGSHNTNIDFQATVSNAKVGVAPKLNIAANSALGLNPTSGYTMITPKYQAVGKYVTWKFTGGPALAGQRVNVLVAKHINGAWGGPVYYKSAWADANGIVTFSWTSKTAAAINVRVQWPGTTAFAVSTSKALGAYYK